MIIGGLPRFPALAANPEWEFSQTQVRVADLPAALGALASLKLWAGRGETLGGWTRERKRAARVDPDGDP